MSKATAPSIFRDLQHLYKILLYVLVLSMLAAFLLIQFNIINPVVDISADRMLQVVAVLYCFAAVFVGLQLFRRKLEQIKTSNSSPREKLNHFKSASILQWGLMESCSDIQYTLLSAYRQLGFSCPVIYIVGYIRRPESI